MSTPRGTPPGFGREEVQALSGLVALFVITAAWWALALWPVNAAPAWLERTRYVCFGVAASGLPDAGGWIGLIAGPLGMLVILAFGWHSGFRNLFLRARHSRPLAGAFAVLALSFVVMLTSAGIVVNGARATPIGAPLPDLPPATYPRIDRVAPALALTDQSGAVVDLADYRGRPVLVTFAYAHCSTVCPLIVQHALRAQELLADDHVSPAVLIVTLDPWRDPPSRLPAMARSWGVTDERAHVLSGAVADVERVLDEWDVPRSRDPDNGEITHPSLLYVIDAEGRIAYASTGGVDALVSLVRRL